MTTKTKTVQTKLLNEKGEEQEQENRAYRQRAWERWVLEEKKRGGRKRNGKQRSLKDDESQVLEAFSKFASCCAATFILKPSESVCLPLVFYKGSVDGFSLERIEPVK